MLTGLLRRAVRADPRKVAIVCGAQRVTYEDLEARVRRFAGGLRARGVGPGDCVAAVLPNGPQFVIAFLATAALRAIFLPLNPESTRSELQRLIQDSQAKLVVASAPGVHIGFDEIDGPALDMSDDEPYRGPALYLYTSGSTDTFKRVCCTQENLYFEALNFVETMRLGADDTILCAIPLFHSYGFGNGLLDALYAGAILVLLDPAESADAGAPFVSQCGRIAELIRDETVRFFPGVPYQFALLAALPAAFPIDLSGVRLCVSSGDQLPRRTFDKFLERFGQPIRSLYGSTEAGSIAIDAGPTIAFGSVGQPLRNVEIEVRDADGAVLPAGEAGEIWVKSPVLPPGGYDNRSAQTAETFRGGFYRTGDVGALDAAGRLTITGRKQSFVDIAGYKVDLGEVEETLQDCPGVREAAAVGLVIENMGTLIKAVIVPEGECREQDVRAFCREQLAFVKAPRLIEFRPALPRSPTGKVLKSELNDAAAYLDRIRDPQTLALLRRSQSAGPDQRLRALRSLVRIQAASVLGRAPAEVPFDQGFTALGMDSFASIELRARLEYLTRTPLPETLTFDHPTVAAVAAHLSLSRP